MKGRPWDGEKREINAEGGMGWRNGNRDSWACMYVCVGGGSTAKESKLKSGDIRRILMGVGGMCELGEPL